MSEFIVDKLTGKSTAKTVTVTVGATATASLEQGLVKAWALTDFSNNSNGDSFNVSTYLDYGAGYGQLSWSNNFSTTNYAVAQACAGSGTNANAVPGSNSNSSKGTGAIRINTMDTSNSNPQADRIDYAEFGTIVTGDLA